MKKIFSYVMIALFSLGFYSCGDNEDFSNLHVLTDAEIAEMERQKAEEEEKRNRIDADLVLEYDVDLTIGQAYEGKRVDIDVDKMCETLGVTKEAFVHTYVAAWDYAYDDAVKMTFFAIEGSTHNDNMGAQTAGTPWSHWWNGSGDVTTWGNNSAVYTEFNCGWDDNDEPTTEMWFGVGQMPDVYTEPTTVSVIEAVKYQDTRVAVKININIKNAEAINATVVDTKEVAVNANVSTTDYASTLVAFDHNEVMAALGIGSMKDAKLVAPKDGAYTDIYTGGSGYWYNADGTVGKYGEAALCVEYYWGSEEYPEDDYTFYLTTMPGVAELGATYTGEIGFMANDKVVLFSFTVAANTIAVATEMRPTETQKTVEFDHNAVMAALGITSMAEATMVNLAPDGTETEGNYTANSGWWYNADGTIGAWPDAAYAVDYYWGSEDWPEDDYTLYIATMGTLESGDVKTATIGFKANDKVVYVKVTLNIVEPIVVKGDIVKEYDVEVSFAASEDAFDGDVITLNTAEIMEAMGVASMSELISFGLDAEGGYTYAYTGNEGEFWYAADGSITTWGEGQTFFVGFYGEDTINVGQMPGVCVAGDEYNVKYGLYAETDKIVMFNIKITVK